MIHQSYDLDADALYITLADRDVARTAEMDQGTLVDLDTMGAVVGIEVIRPQRAWPVRELISKFGIDRSTASYLLAYFGNPAQIPAQMVAPAHPAPDVPVRVPANA
jgi:uncharacterized protein YuzE